MFAIEVAVGCWSKVFALCCDTPCLQKVSIFQKELVDDKIVDVEVIIREWPFAMQL